LPFADGSDSVNIYPPGSKPYGLTYADHVKNFWKWLLSIPSDQSPINEQKNEGKCAEGQSNSNSSIFFLSQTNGGGKVERTCKVPAGKGLFIPVMRGEASFLEVPTAKTVKDLSDNVKNDQDGVVSLNLKIEDKEYGLQDLRPYRVHTDDFDVVFARNGLYGQEEGGSTRSVADGYYVITEPLPKGNYTVSFNSILICPAPECPTFSEDVTYHIIAE
jgi:hypothetical protein